MENRFQAETVGDFTRCIICNQLTRAIHWHHTVPRALGGVDSLQIPIDGNCHTALHAKADATVALLAGNRKDAVGNFWSDGSDLRAEPWLRILVDAMLNPPVSPEDKQVLLPSISVGRELRFALDLLKRDLPGVTNLGQVLLYCVNFTLNRKGYNHEKDGSFSHSGSHKRNDLW